MSALDDLNKKNWREMSTLEYLIYITHDSIGIKAACATELSDLCAKVASLEAERSRLAQENIRLNNNIDFLDGKIASLEARQRMNEISAPIIKAKCDGCGHISEIERLKAERTWQPIEDAPNETLILLCRDFDDRGYDYRVIDSYFADDEAYVGYYWTYLPKPPKEAEWSQTQVQ